MRIDLHTHSDCSDGLLSPSELVARAALREVACLALTDHDTIAGCAAARAACERAGIRFLAGIELSASWQEREIHIVGLAVDCAEPGLEAHCAAQRQLRCDRIHAIGERLDAAGLPGAALAATALEAALPTRTHLARALHAGGFARDTADAFERWLQRGRPGHVRARFPGLAQTLETIHAAGGLAVLAHPHRYPLRPSALNELVGEFKALGGSALEVSLPAVAPAAADRVASLARRHGLAGSIGSDFHEPDLPWRPLGRFAKLPDRIESIMMQLDGRDSPGMPPQES